LLNPFHTAFASINWAPQPALVPQLSCRPWCWSSSLSPPALSRAPPSAGAYRWSESSFLGRLPHYQVIKSMAEGLAHIENASGLKPALVSIEDGWQIGYLLEKLENDWVAVFLPQAPTPMSGNIMYLPSNRVRLLGITMVEAMSLVKSIGAGSGAALRGVDSSCQAAMVD
jgi:hypothetical protein